MLFAVCACLAVILGGACGRSRPPPVVGAPERQVPAAESEPVSVEPAEADEIPLEVETTPLEPIDRGAVPIERVDAAPSAADIADAAFAAGRLGEAVAAYEAVLGTKPEGPDADRARFRLGLIHAGPETPFFNLSRAVELLSEVGRSSDGTHAAEAGILVELLLRLRKIQGDAEDSREELRRISHELERLKAIDQERRRGGLP